MARRPCPGVSPNVASPLPLVGERDQDSQCPTYGVSGQLFTLFGHPYHGGLDWKPANDLVLFAVIILLFVDGASAGNVLFSNKFRVDWAIPQSLSRAFTREDAEGIIAWITKCADTAERRADAVLTPK